MIVNCPSCGCTMRKPSATMVAFGDELLGVHLVCPDCEETFIVWFDASPFQGTVNDSITIVPRKAAQSAE